MCKYLYVYIFIFFFLLNESVTIKYMLNRILLRFFFFFFFQFNSKKSKLIGNVKYSIAVKINNFWDRNT